MLECALLLEITPHSGARVTDDGTRGALHNDGEVYEQKHHLGSGDPLRFRAVVFRLGSIVSCNDDAFQ